MLLWIVIVLLLGSSSARAGDSLPGDIALVDDRGAPVLSSALLLQGRPVVLAPVYYRCPDLCPLTAHQLLANVEKLRLAAGRDFTLTFIGILPTEDVNDATAARQAWGAPPSARFLRVADANAAARLRAALDIGVAGTSGDPSFRHEAVVAILSPTGGLSRRFVGYSYSADDLEQSLVEAASGRVATLGDRILLFCTHLDPRTGRHTGVVLLAFRVAAVLGLGALATIVWRLSRR